MKKWLIVLVLILVCVGGVFFSVQKTSTVKKETVTGVQFDQDKALQQKIALFIVNNFDGVEHIRIRKISRSQMGSIIAGVVLNKQYPLNMTIDSLESFNVSYGYSQDFKLTDRATPTKLTELPAQVQVEYGD